MKNKVMLMLRVQLHGMLGLHRLRGDSKGRGKTLLVAVSGVLLVAMVLLYTMGLTYAYVNMGMEELPLPVLFMAASIVTLITGIYKANGTMFGFRDYDMTMSLPVTVPQVVISRVLTMYLLDLLFAALIMLPAGLYWGYLCGPGLSYYFQLVLFTLLLPVFPLVLATAGCALIMAVASRFRYKNLITTVLTLGFVAVVILFSFQAQKIDAALVTDVSQTLLSVVNNTYPPARLFYQGIMNAEWISVLIFLLLSLGVFAVYVLILSKFYEKINTALMTHQTRGNYQVGELKKNSAWKAVFHKEWKRLWGSPGYLVNCGMGTMMMILAAVAVFLLDLGDIEVYMETPGLAGWIASYGSYIICMLVGMTTTTAVSTSLEGNSIWILMSAPISSRDIFLGKAALNLVLTVPCSVFTSVLFAIKVHSSFVEFLFLLLLPAAYSVVMAFAGICLNLLFLNLEWTNEIYVIKRSAAVIIQIFAGMLVPFLPVLLIVWLGLDYSLLVSAIFLFLLAGLAAVAYRYLGQVDLKARISE